MSTLPTSSPTAPPAMLDTLLAALAKAFQSNVAAPPRARHEISHDPRVSMLVMPSWGFAELAGVKIVTIASGNRDRGLPSVAGTYVLMEAQTGVVIAVLDAHALTLRRTSAVSALAASYLAPADVSTLVVVGSGDLAPHLALAHANVRQYERILVWGRRAQRAEAVAGSLRARGLPAVVASDLAQACCTADVISCATLSDAPLVRGEWLRPGTYLDLVGSFRPDMRETDDDVMARAHVVVDTETALVESGDLLEPLRNGRLSRDRITLLADVLRHGASARADLTVFKSVGTAVADLCTAAVDTGRYAP
jgi:ornithine cyclodeaminase